MDRNIKILAVLPGLIPSTILSVVKPLLLLHNLNEIEFKVRLSKACKEKDIIDSDVVVFCRNSVIEDMDCLYWAKKHNKKIIYDIDDNFFQIDINTAIGKYHRHPIHLYILKQFIELADLVRVYSNPMKNYCSKMNSNVKLLNTYFDFDLIKNLSQSNHDKTKIVYATSRLDKDELYEIFSKALIRIIDKYENRIEIFIWGAKDSRLSKFKCIKYMQFERDYNKFIRKFYQYGFDIGLAPLKDDIFHKSKTNNKFREYGACKIAGIYSNTEVYRNCVEDEKTGLLVNNNEQEWFDAIEKFILNKELLNEIKKNSYDKILEFYSMDSFVDEWRKNINYIINCNFQNKVNYNIKNLKIASILCNSEYDDLINRIDSYRIVIENLGIENKWRKFEDVSEVDITSADINIIFSNRVSESLETIRYIYKYSKNIIVDINVIDIDKDAFMDITKTYNQIIFVISSNVSVISKCNNVYLIEDFVIDERKPELDKYSLRYIIPYININGSEHFNNNKFLTKSKSNSSNYKQIFYSDKSPMIAWGEVLKLFSPAGEKKHKIYIPNSVLRAFNLFKKICFIISNFIHKTKNKIKNLKNLIKYLFLYYKINLFKRY